jgi:hypothetical protein
MFNFFKFETTSSTMFGVFSKSDKNKIKAIDKVWMSKEAKYNACRQMFEVDKLMLFIVWFEGTRSELSAALALEQGNKTVVLAPETSADLLRNRINVFAEHYPLASVEQKEFQRLMLSEVNVMMSLDEPFFANFGGEKTIELMKKLGMNENEVLGHSMIDRSIRNAQKKLEENVKAEHKASSQAEWFRLNAKS